MYADDTVIFYSGKSINEIENVVSADLSMLNSWLNVNKLFLHVDKTECVLFGSAKRLHTTTNFEISINGQRIKQVPKYKYLGVIMDDSLSWKDHVQHILMKASARLGMLRRLRNDISIHTANIVYKSYILPILDYCDTVWNCCNVGDEEKLEKIQRRVARVVMKVGCSHDALNDLRWETLKNRREQHVFKLVKKCVNGTIPQFLANYFSFNREVKVRTTRQSNLLYLPKVRTEMPKKSFYYNGVQVFNRLCNSLN